MTCGFQKSKIHQLGLKRVWSTMISLVNEAYPGTWWRLPAQKNEKSSAKGHGNMKRIYNRPQQIMQICVIISRTFRSKTWEYHQKN